MNICVNPSRLRHGSSGRIRACLQTRCRVKFLEGRSPYRPGWRTGRRPRPVRRPALHPANGRSCGCLKTRPSHQKLKTQKTDRIFISSGSTTQELVVDREPVERLRRGRPAERIPTARSPGLAPASGRLERGRPRPGVGISPELAPGIFTAMFVPSGTDLMLFYLESLVQSSEPIREIRG